MFELSSQFHKQIPLLSRKKTITIIDDIEKIRIRFKALEGLKAIMTISSLYKSLELEAGGEKNPIDLIHEELPTKFSKMKPETEEYEVAQKMLNTMGPTHTKFDLDLIEVYKLDNATQKAENWAFRKVKSRLLWFGGRKTEHAHIMK